MKRKLIILIIVLVLGVLVVSKYFENVNDQKRYEELSEKYNEKLKELRSEKDSLNKELNTLNSELSPSDLGSTILLIGDTSDKHLTQAIVSLDFFDYRGVIAISSDFLPDDNLEGYMNRNDIDELVNKGYEVVLKVGNKDLLEDYNHMIELGYDIKGLYFTSLVLNDTNLKEIKSINEDLVLLSNSLVLEDDDLDVLAIEVYGANGQGVKTTYTSSVNTSKTVALASSYLNSNSAYTKNNYEAMLKTILDYERNNKTKVTNISEACDRYKVYQEELASSKKETFNRIEEIKDRLKKIEELESQMKFYN